MYRTLSLFTITVFVCAQFVSADNDGTFNIVTGNCTWALAKDMIYTEHVHKYAIPFVIRDAESSWYGDQKIYCIKALNANEESEGGYALIKEGGIGHNFVTIEMHSDRGNTLEYQIEIFAT